MLLTANQTQDLQLRSAADRLAHPGGKAASSVSIFETGVVDGEFAQVGESREVRRGVELLTTLEFSYVLSLGKGSRARAYKVVCEMHVSQIRKLGQGVEDSRVRQGVRQAEAERSDVS